MNNDMRLWKKASNRKTVCHDFLSYEAWFCLQIVPGKPSNVLESRKGFELTWKVEFSFEFSLIFLELAYGFLQQLAREWH